MKNTISLSQMTKPLTSFIARYHTIMFFIIVSMGLFIAILSLLSIIDLSSQTATSSDRKVDGTFDEKMIEEIRNGTTVQVTPGARKSPFTE